MPSRIIKGYKQLVAEANAQITTLSVENVIARLENPDTLLVDLRDPRERDRDGCISRAFHCPRGMLEFWIDPESPYAKSQFQQDVTFVFFCAGGLRSALAARTAQDMGLRPVAHMEGGFAAWRKAGGPVEAPGKKGE